MYESILSAIDSEISRLTQVKALLSSVKPVAVKRKPGRPANAESIAPISPQTKKRRKLSAEVRERIRQAQIKRWAVVRQAATHDANTAAPAPRKPKKKAAKITA
jgi:hypothetical protein